jgi:hypothetical protein
MSVMATIMSLAEMVCSYRLPDLHYPLWRGKLGLGKLVDLLGNQ